MARKNWKRNGPRFIQLYHHVYDSKAFTSLSLKAVRVYLELMRAYNGSNDNNLSLTYAELHNKYGFSTATSSKAFKELVEHGFIDTKVHGGLRVGLKTGQCNIYGLSERWKSYGK